MKPALAIWFTAGLLALPARGDSVRDGPVEASLIADIAAVSPGVPFTVAFRMKLDPPWHAYWTNPGDSGLAPSLEWTLPEGFTAGELQFPAPKAIPTPPFMTYGHEGEVHFLATITPPAAIAQDQVVLAAEADWLVCAELCIPGYAELELVLPVGEGPPAPHPVHADVIAAAQARLPADASGWRIQARSSPDRYWLSAVPPAEAGRDIESAYFFPAAPGIIRHVAPQDFQPATDGFQLALVPTDPEEPPPGKLSGVMVVQGPDGTSALRVDIPFSEATSPRPMNPERNTP
jgi:DsbC/DsbD-like thiol-disulfide interchange protein